MGATRLCYLGWQPHVTALATLQPWEESWGGLNSSLVGDVERKRPEVPGCHPQRLSPRKGRMPDSISVYAWQVGDTSLCPVVAIERVLGALRSIAGVGNSRFRLQGVAVVW
jgi:hypothetical protein